MTNFVYFADKGYILPIKSSWLQSYSVVINMLSSGKKSSKLL